MRPVVRHSALIATRRGPNLRPFCAPAAARKSLLNVHGNSQESENSPGIDLGLDFGLSVNSDSKSDRPDELDSAVWAKTVAASRKRAVLTTVDTAALNGQSQLQGSSVDSNDIPSKDDEEKRTASALFGGVVPILAAARETFDASAFAEDGSPELKHLESGLWFGVQAKAEHERNLLAHSRCSVLLQPGLPPQALANDASSIPLPRLNLRGTARPLAEVAAKWSMLRAPRVVAAANVQASVSAAFTEQHPAAEDLLAKREVNLWHFEPSDVFHQRHAGARPEPLDIGLYQRASVDPVGIFSQEISRKLTDRFSENQLDLLVKVYGGTEVQPGSTFLTWVDKYGCNVVAKDRFDEWCSFRLPFPFDMESPEQCFDALEEAVHNLLDSERELAHWNDGSR